MKKTEVVIRKNRKIFVKDNEKRHYQPMIFLHGLTGNHLQLQFYIEHFDERYRTIAIDFRGRGNSGKAESKSSIHEHALDVLSLIEVLGLQRPIVVGYSMGAYVASVVASKMMVDKLILLDGAASIDDFQNKIVVPTFGRLSNRYDSENDYVNQVLEKYVNMGVEASDKLRSVILYEVTKREDGWYNKAIEETIRQDWSSFQEYDVESVCSQISAKTLLVEATGNIGSYPPLFPKKYYTKTETFIQNITVKLTDANHYSLVFQHRVDVIMLMEDFIGRT